MKKLSIVVLLVIGALAALPIIGNKYVSSTMEQRVSELKAHGLQVKESHEESSYLTSSKHYEFVLQDGAKFIKFLNQYAINQVPSYVDSLLGGIVVGVDVHYSNIPFFSTIELDIYPLDFSKDMMESLKKNDRNFYKQLNKFLTSKSLNYHMNYHLSSEHFDGYLKDIDQTFYLDDGAVFHLGLNNIKFDGEGRLIAPTSSNFIMGQVKFNITDQNSKFVFAFEDLKGSSRFESKTTYDTDIKMKNFKFIVDEQYNDMYINLNELKGKFSSDDKDEKTQLFGDTSFKEMMIKDSQFDLVLKGFKYELALTQLDKELFAKLQTLLSQQRLQRTQHSIKEMEETLVELLAKGLELNIKNISVDDILYNNNVDYKGMKFNALLTIKADPDLKRKIKEMPMEALNNLDLKSELVLSKELYEVIEKNGSDLSEYADIQGEEVKFNSLLKNGRLSVNGKIIK